ncbi:MAG: hypothetical protein ACOYON_16300 [Fimbriimonas sp.]
MKDILILVLLGVTGISLVAWFHERLIRMLLREALAALVDAVDGPGISTIDEVMIAIARAREVLGVPE